MIIIMELAQGRGNTLPDNIEVSLAQLQQSKEIVAIDENGRVGRLEGKDLFVRINQLKKYEMVILSVLSHDVLRDQLDGILERRHKKPALHFLVVGTEAYGPELKQEIIISCQNVGNSTLLFMR